MKIGNVNLEWLGHSGFKIKDEKTSNIIYIDPYMIRENSEKADIILITHSHYDHCSVADINKIVKEGTKIVITADSQSNITRLNFNLNIIIVEPEQELTLGNTKISTLPAYNTDKSFHKKNEGWVGYLIKMESALIYHAGDSDNISEMHRLTGFSKNQRDFIALLPIGGRFTMNAEEAVEAAKVMKPTLVIPMHYGSVVGTDADAKEFVQICKEEGINALMLEKS